MKINSIIVVLFVAMTFNSCLLVSRLFPYSDTWNYKYFSESDMAGQLSADYNPDPDSLLNVNGVYLLYNDSTKSFVRHYTLVNRATECVVRPIENGFMFHKDGSISAISCNFDSLNVCGDSILFDEALFNKVITIKGCTGVYRVSGEKLLISIIYNVFLSDWHLETIRAHIVDDDMFCVYYNSDTYYSKSYYRKGIPEYLRKEGCYFKLLPTLAVEPSMSYDGTKDREWMWADKKDLKEYRRKVKAYEDSVKQLRK